MEQFKQMTSREVAICLRRIHVRRHNERAREAANFGHQIQRINVVYEDEINAELTEKDKFSEIDDARAAEVINQAMQRKLMEANGAKS